MKNHKLTNLMNHNRLLLLLFVITALSLLATASHLRIATADVGARQARAPLAAPGLASVPAATHCVKPDGGDGCFTTVGAALAAASAGDLIQVAAGTYEENVVLQKNIILEGGWNADFSLRDPAAFSTTIRPDDPEQAVVSIDNVDPTIDGFIITGAEATNHGGGLRIIDSNALIRNNTIISNTAYLLGGGIWVQRGAPTLENNRIEDNRSQAAAQDAFGGGVQLENSQAVLIDNFIISNVVSGSYGYGGGIAVNGGSIHLTGNLLVENRASGPGYVGYGGGLAIHNAAVVSLKDIHVEANRSDGGGGIYSDGGSLDIWEATIVGNRATTNIPGSGGGIYTLSGVITLGQSALADNLAGYGGGIYNSDSQLTVRDTAFRENDAAFRGGGVNNSGDATLINVTIANNEAGDGGGIANFGVATLTDATLSSNSAGSRGGGIYSSNETTLNNITISDNTADLGGGIYSGGITMVTNATLSGNSAIEGGGLYHTSMAGTTTLVNSTVSDNTADAGGGIYTAVFPTTYVANTIVAANSDDNCAGEMLLSNGYNLEDADTCGLDPNMNDMINTDPLLGPLADNGGPTPTHALDPTSPAVDAADKVACPYTDQRGLPRVDGDFDGTITCDIGAYELVRSFTVNSTADKVDADEGDGACDTGDMISGEPECTLRAAIQEANALGGAEMIAVPAGTYQLTIEDPPPVAPVADDFAASGDLDIRVGLTIQATGPDSTIIDGGALDRVFHIIPDVVRGIPPMPVEISGVTVQNGATDGSGGGISNFGILTLRDTIIRDNTAGTFGGAVFNDLETVFTVVNSTITGNFGADSGGIHSDADATTTVLSSTISLNTTDGSGGAINDNGFLTIANSTLHANVAATNGGALNHAAGDATLFNVTISGNSADLGGGLRNHADTTATFANVTIADNEANGGGGIYNDGDAILVNTIIAGNEAGNCVANNTLTSEGHNLEDANTCGFDAAVDDVITPDARLGSLADNGGPTLTHALLAGSPAIDAGDNLNCPDTDQRGVIRPVDGNDDAHPYCDIGAFEFKPSEPPEPPGDTQMYLPIIR